MINRTTLAALAVLALAAPAVLALAAPAARAQDVINFDAFPSPPPRTSLAPLFLANNNNRTYDGVTFPQSALVIGDQCSNGNAPLVKPSSGLYAFGSGNSQTTTLSTTKTLYGLSIGQINNTHSAAGVTINALDASGAVLQSLTDTFSGTPLSFFDTSAFAKLSGITGYSLVAQSPTGVNNAYDFAGDDFTFSAPPVPPVLNGLFDFDTDSIGTGANPTSVHSTFTDLSGGINATFSTSADTSDSGGFGVQSNPFPGTALLGNVLATPSGAGKYKLPLSIAFDHTLQSGSVAFASSATVLGTFTVQELLNGAVVGTVSTTSQGTVSFLNGVSFNSLVVTDTNAVFAIDNLSVSSAPEPSQWAAFLVGALGLGALTVKARRRAA